MHQTVLKSQMPKLLDQVWFEEIKPWYLNHKRIPKNKILFLKITYDEIHFSNLYRIIEEADGIVREVCGKSPLVKSWSSGWKTISSQPQRGKVVILESFVQ